MDSMSGHSEENRQKRNKAKKAMDEIDENVKFIQEGDVRKIDISELPWEEQERIRSFMEMTGEEEPPELYMADFKMQVTDLKYLPMEILAHGLRDAIVDNNYEEAEDLSVEIKKRGYAIDISDKLLTLTYKPKS